MGKVIQLSTSAQLATPATKERTGGRQPGPRGERMYITPQEFDAVLKALDRNSRTFERDYCMFLLAYHHGLRLSEAVSMQWSDVDWTGSSIYVRRLKGSVSGSHPLSGNEMRALRRWQRFQPRSAWIFSTWKGRPMCARAAQEQFRKTALKAGVPVRLCHWHSMRHGAGYALINNGVNLKVLQVWLGHKNIQNTDRYSALADEALRKLHLWD